jgi:hypothetical protein
MKRIGIIGSGGFGDSVMVEYLKHKENIVIIGDTAFTPQSIILAAPDI